MLDGQTSRRSHPLNWQVILQLDEESGDWAAWCPQLPGCASAGASRAEALDNIREAIELYLEPHDETLPPDAEVHRVEAA